MEDELFFTFQRLVREATVITEGSPIPYDVKIGTDDIDIYWAPSPREALLMAAEMMTEATLRCELYDICGIILRTDQDDKFIGRYYELKKGEETLTDEEIADIYDNLERIVEYYLKETQVK